MIKYRQHIPGFVDADPFEIEADTFDQIMTDERILRTRKEDKTFHRFSVTPNDGEWSKACLIAEYKEGKEWWVLGYTSIPPEETGLPIWSAKK